MGRSYLEPFYQYHWCLPYPGHRKNEGGKPILAGRWMGMMRWLPIKPFWMDACRLVDIWKDACWINACEACRSLMMVTSLIPSIQFRPGEALFYGRWLSTSSTESYRIILMSIIFIFIHIIFVLVFPKVFWPCHRWLSFSYVLFFWGNSYNSHQRLLHLGSTRVVSWQDMFEEPTNHSSSRTSWTGTSCDFLWLV